MMHNRKWFIKEVTSSAEVVSLMTTYQNVCFGIRYEGFLFLNDRTDTGVREYAIVDEALEAQVDSWLIQWMTNREIERTVLECVKQRGKLPAFQTEFEYSHDMIVNKPLQN